MKKAFRTVCLFGCAAFILTAAVCNAQEWWKEKQAGSSVDQKKVVARDDLQGQVASAVRVNWNDQYIEVMAGATADAKDAANLGHAYSMAIKTARHLAYEKLAETVKGISINSDATYDRELMRDANLKTEVNALIQGARVVQEEKKQMVDGSVWVEVTIGLKLNGAGGLMQPTAQWLGRNPVIDKPVIFAPGVEEVKGSPAYTGGFTGLIVDAGGLQATPAMLPRIKTPDGKEVFGQNEVNREYMINQGLVGYADSVSKAQTMRRVGSNPLIVKAVGVEGANKSNIVVSPDDALQIASASANSNFIKECKVVVVIN